MGVQFIDLDGELRANLERILTSPTYRVASADLDFLGQDALRAVRMQLDLMKAEIALKDQRIRSTIVVLGGTHVVAPPDAHRRLHEAKQRLSEQPDDPIRLREVSRAERVVAKSRYYEAAYEFSRLASPNCTGDGPCDGVIVTGGGPGIMEAANRGAYHAGSKSIGLNITLPDEQRPNPFITPELCLQFRYFAMRKIHFLLRAKALVIFPGGFGTLDELFDALTLRQTRRMQQIPIILFGREYWERVIDFQFLADEGVIADEHLILIQYAETPEEAWDMIVHYRGKEVSRDY